MSTTSDGIWYDYLPTGLSLQLSNLTKTIARYVLNNHMNRPNQFNESNDEGELGLDKMKRYIAYCKRYDRPPVLSTSSHHE